MLKHVVTSCTPSAISALLSSEIRLSMVTHCLPGTQTPLASPSFVFRCKALCHKEAARPSLKGTGWVSNSTALLVAHGKRAHDPATCPTRPRCVNASRALTTTHTAPSSMDAAAPCANSVAHKGGILEVRGGDVHIVWTFTDKVQKSVDLWQLFRERFLPPEELAELGVGITGKVDVASKLDGQDVEQQQRQREEQQLAGHDRQTQPHILHHHNHLQHQQQQACPGKQVQQLEGAGACWSYQDERLLARVLTRTTLAAALNGIGRGLHVTPDALCFVRNPHGKPFLLDPTNHCAAHPDASSPASSSSPTAGGGTATKELEVSGLQDWEASLIQQQLLAGRGQQQQQKRQQQRTLRARQQWEEQQHAQMKQQEDVQQCIRGARQTTMDLWSPDLGLSSQGLPPLQFNTTHTSGVVGCAVAPAAIAVGLDVERLGRVPKRGKLMALARRRFAAAECAALEACANNEGQQARLFSYLWSLKEAALKARGTGISAPPGLKGFAIGLQGLEAPGGVVTLGAQVHSGTGSPAWDVDLSGVLQQLCPKLVGLEADGQMGSVSSSGIGGGGSAGSGAGSMHRNSDGSSTSASSMAFMGSSSCSGVGVPAGSNSEGSESCGRGAGTLLLHIAMDCGEGGGLQWGQRQPSQSRLQQHQPQYHFLLLHLSSEHVAALCLVVPPHFTWPRGFVTNSSAAPTAMVESSPAPSNQQTLIHVQFWEDTPSLAGGQSRLALQVELAGQMLVRSEEVFGNGGCDRMGDALHEEGTLKDVSRQTGNESVGRVRTVTLIGSSTG